MPLKVELLKVERHKSLPLAIITLNEAPPSFSQFPFKPGELSDLLRHLLQEASSSRKRTPSTESRHHPPCAHLVKHHSCGSNNSTRSLLAVLQVERWEASDQDPAAFLLLWKGSREDLDEVHAVVRNAAWQSSLPKLTSGHIDCILSEIPGGSQQGLVGFSPGTKVCRCITSYYAAGAGSGCSGRVRPPPCTAVSGLAASEHLAAQGEFVCPTFMWLKLSRRSQEVLGERLAGFCAGRASNTRNLAVCLKAANWLEL